MPVKDKPPVSMRIRLKYPDVQTFVEKYSANISGGGMFIQSRAPQPVGTPLRFELMLQDGTPLLKGDGVVIWVKEYDITHPQRVHGMGIRFGELDDGSRAMVERIMAWKAAADTPATTAQEQRDTGKHTVNEQNSEPSIHPIPSGLPAEDKPPPGEQSDSPPPPPREKKPSSLFAALLNEASREQATSRPASISAAVAVQEETASPAPALSVSQPHLPPDPLLAATVQFGDGVGVALEMAEQMLCDLLRQSGISEEQLAGVRPQQSISSIAELEAELQELASSVGLPQQSLDQAVTVAARWSGSSPSPLPAPPGMDLDAEAAATVKPKAPVAEADTPIAPPPHVAEADTPIAPPPHVAEADTPIAPPPPVEPGWADLHTATQLLDHDSSAVLRDMAKRSLERARATEQLPLPKDHDTSIAQPPEPTHTETGQVSTEAAPADKAKALELSENEGAHNPESAFEGAGPGERLAAPPSDSTDVAHGGGLEMIESIDLTKPAEPPPVPPPIDVGLEELLEPPPARSLAHDIFSDLDLQAIDKFGEYEETAITESRAVVDIASPIAQETPRSPTTKPADVLDLVNDEPHREPDVFELESAPLDEEQPLRADPDLESEVFEALAGVQDTLLDGSKSAHKTGATSGESVPELDALTELTSQPSQQTEPPSQDIEFADVDSSETDADGQKSLRPRRSGILKRLFGKKTE